MRRSLTLPLVIASLLAPRLARAGGGDADKPAAPPVAAPALLADLAVFGDGGLQLGSTALVSGPVTSAAYDPDEDLVWLISKGALKVIDLRDPKRTAVVIAKNLPTAGFEVTGLGHVARDIDYAAVYTIIHLDQKGKVEVGHGAYGGIDEQGDKRLARAVKKVKFVGGKWLAAQKSRKANAAATKRADPPTIKLPTGVGSCEDETFCGQAMWLEPSPYQIVIVEHSCGDACHESCVLYDPARKQFASLLADGGWTAKADTVTPAGCDSFGYRAEPGGGHYFGETTLCTLGGKMTCTDLGAWTPFAWITPPAPAP
jgi:hypothetical protein